jgi:hypothetical protein
VPRRVLLYALATILAAGVAFGGNGFGGIVNSLQNEYGVQETKIPFMGLANALVKVARPYGVSGFRFAIFEDLDLHPEERDGFLTVIRRGAGRKWTPMIEISSNRSGERTVIFVRKTGGKMNMVLAAYNSGEATVMQMKVDPGVFGQWIQEPRHTGVRMRSAGDY